MPERDVQAPSDLLNKLSSALIQVSRGDPLTALRNELQTRFLAIDVRFDAIDKATELQHEDQVRVPTQIDKATASLREFLEQSFQKLIAELRGELNRHVAETAEKFRGVDNQFSERDTRTDQRAGDTKLAVDAAFAAAKEATAKIEAGFTKQIDGMGDNVNTKTANLASGISDIKDRLTTVENRRDPLVDSLSIRLTALENRGSGVKEGTHDTTAKQQQQWGFIFGLASLAVAAIAVFGFLTKVPAPGLH